MRRKLMLLLAAVSLSLVGLALLGSHYVPPVYIIRSEMLLPASREASWLVLSDFARYPTWNPYLPRIEGTLEPGESLTLTLVDANFDAPLTVQARVAEVLPPERFFWTGRVGIPGLFDTRHVFELAETAEGQTTLHHYEEFRGLIAILWPNRAQRTTNTLAAFDTMNSALREELSRAGRGQVD